jgi:F5/8 type C domain/PQQ-like domain
MKKTFLALTASAMIFSVATPSATVQANGNYQGSQFEQGTYDTEAEFPYGSNWSKNSPHAGSEINKVKWEFKIPHPTGGYQRFFSAPAIGKDGTLYILNENGKLYALNKDGSAKWEIQLNALGRTVPVIGEDGTLYVAAGHLYAINPDGSIKWKTSNTRYFRTPAIGSDGSIYVLNDADETINALNNKGELMWASQSFGNYSTGYQSGLLISKDNTIYFVAGGSSTAYLYALDEKGQQKWRKTLSGSLNSSYLTLGKTGEIYVSAKQSVYIFDKYGNEVDVWELSDNISTALTIDKNTGISYIGVGKSLYALETNGKVKWEQKFNSYPRTSPVIDKNGTIYIGVSDVKDAGFYAITPEGQIKWKTDMGYYEFQSAPTTEVVMDRDGIIYAVGGVQKYSSLVAIGGTKQEENENNANLALNKTSSASNIWFESAKHTADKAFDGDPNTRWATDDGITNATLSVDFGKETTFNNVHINEFQDKTQGIQRITGFNIEYWNGSEWKVAHTGTTIGADFKVEFPAVTGTQARLNITSVEGKYGPSIYEFGVYNTK